MFYFAFLCHRLVNETTLKRALPQDVVKWNCHNLWKYRTHIDVQHLKLKLEAVDENTSGWFRRITIWLLIGRLFNKMMKLY